MLFRDSDQTNQVAVKSADLIKGHFIIDFRETEFLVIVGDDRILVFNADKDHVGTIKIGGPDSGGIWLSGDFVGEYRLDTHGQYKVCSVENGFKVPDKSVNVNPVVHLLAAFSAK